VASSLRGLKIRASPQCKAQVTDRDVDLAVL